MAAHDVLVGLMPAQQATLDAALASSLAAVPDGRAEDAGVAFGKLVADRMLAERADDGSTDVVTYVPGTGPDDWQPTPPAFAPAALPQWATVEPFGITSPDQFRADPPPALDSPEFTQAFNQIKAIGAANSTTRTAEQTDIARFWAGPSGTVQPPGHWNSIARGVADAQDNSLAQNARLFALLNIGMADALITAWDTKFEYSFVRPVTAIRNADNDGNPDTAADPAWSPLLTTPGASVLHGGPQRGQCHGRHRPGGVLRERRHRVHVLGRGRGRRGSHHPLVRRLLGGGAGSGRQPDLRRHPLVLRQPGRTPGRPLRRRVRRRQPAAAQGQYRPRRRPSWRCRSAAEGTQQCAAESERRRLRSSQMRRTTTSWIRLEHAVASGLARRQARRASPAADAPRASRISVRIV